MPSHDLPGWFEADDPHLTEKMRQVTEIAAAQRELGDAFEHAVAAFFTAARQALDITAAAFDAWPAREEVWRDVLTEFVFGVIEELFTRRFTGQIRAEIRVDVDALADAYLDEVWQRLAGWPDHAFDEVRADYADAVQAGLDGDELDTLLADMLRLDAPSRSRQAEITRLTELAADSGARDSVRQQAREKLVALRDDESRRGKRWWPHIAELTRTQALAALNAGTAQGADTYAEATGQPRYKVWWSAEDQRVRPAHISAHGQVRPTGERFSVGGYPMRFPGDPAAPTDLIANCVTADTRIDAAEVLRAYRRYYSGPLVRIELDGAEVLSVSPNHPVLTPRGWIPACHVNEGDHLVGAFFGRDFRQAAPDVERQPATAAQVFDSVSQFGAASRLPLLPVDFHGDGQGSEVEIVGADRELRVGFQSSSRQQLTEFLLACSDQPAAGGGLAFQLSLARRSSTASRVRRRDLTTTIPDIAHVGPLHGFSGTAVSQRDTSLAEGSRDGGAADARTASQRVDRFASQVPAHDLRPERLSDDARAWVARGGLATAGNRQSGLVGSAPDGVDAGVESTCDGSEGFAAIQTYRQVTDVQVLPAWHGYLFNFETTHGAYVASGVINGNCRCSILSVSASEADRLQQRAQRNEGVTMMTTADAVTGDEIEPAALSAAATFDEQTVRRWRGVLAPVDRRSPDGRVLAAPDGEDAVLHRTLPLPLLYQEKTGPGHDGAVIVGNIQRVWVDDGAVMGEGEFDLGNDTAREVVRQIDGGFHRWVSITHDPDADYEFKYFRGATEVDPAEVLVESGRGVYIDDDSVQEVRVATNWRLSDATLVATPAFDEAAIELVTSEPDTADGEDRDGDGERPGEQGARFAAPSEAKRDRAEESGAAMEGGRFPIENTEDLRNAIRAVGRTRPATESERAKVRRHIIKRAKALGETDLVPESWNSDGTLKTSNAAALLADAGKGAWCERVAEAVPLEPPAHWFSDPELSGYTKPTISDEGRVFGHICPWDVTHAGDPRVQPPRHGTTAAYAKFHRHPVRVDGGDRILTGPLTTGGHAESHARTISDVMRHYDSVEHVLGHVTVGEDSYGLWFSGALRPGVTPLQILTFDQLFVSGDWRNGELLAACVVSVPGFHRTGALIDSLVASADGPVPVIADAAPSARIEDGQVVTLLAAGLWSAPTLQAHTSGPEQAGADPEEWGQRVGRGMYAGFRAAETEEQDRMAAEAAAAERRRQVAEFRQRVGTPVPPEVAALRRRVEGSKTRGA